MASNPYWSRWIVASCMKHFKAIYVASPYSLNVHCEGQPRQTNELQEWLEVRVDGPRIRRITKTQYDIYCEVNILCCVVPNQNVNSYRIHDLTGIAAEGFTNEVALLKIGPATDPENDGTQFGCLRLESGAREAIRVNIFGEVRPDTAMVQAAVEGHYTTFLEST